MIILSFRERRQRERERGDTDKCSQSPKTAEREID
jgi:hypothetical protein